MSDSNFIRAMFGNANVDHDAVLKMGRAFGMLPKVSAPPKAVTVRKDGAVDIETTARLLSSVPSGSAMVETWEVDIEGHPRFQCYDDRRSQFTARGKWFGSIPQGYIYAKGDI